MRIDLAGGTLDVYPLYIFEGGGLTVNAAIDIQATARVATQPGQGITLRSEDLDYQEQIASLEQMAFGGPLDLIKRALAYYRPECGLDISVGSQAPQGSGIGASSALLMALSHCLNAITGKGLDAAHIIDIGANIEAQLIGIPTGKQDYFPPIFGGVCAIWFAVDGWRLESLSRDNELVALLDERVIVSYTGIPHSSAATNWAMLKAYIERQGNSVARMREIKAIAEAMRRCLIDRDMQLFGELVDAEWQLRKGLADGVTNDEIDAIMTAARAAGASANKICGAGGGGCMITIADPIKTAAVREALEAAGARVLSAHVVADGIQLHVTA
jgi:D-glycero-alpha-D-manno-heptose-7-phosphate kinase